jgi:flavorubredoxin
MPQEILPGVHWVGVVDWALRRFHGHELSTHRGSSYNAYLIKDEKTVLVDTVWDPFAEEFLDGLRQLIDPADIDIVVTNHSEMDHSGSLPELMRLCPDAEVVVSKKGAESVPGHYHQDWNFRTVSTGESIDIGSRKLVFVEAPMLHWPDSMFTYLTGSNLLMPNDAFGQHYATSSRFNDEVDQVELYQEAVKYYANILTPFSDLVRRKIDEVVGLELPVDMIAPSHGILWRDEPMQIVHKYAEWAAQEPTAKASILYDTMWEGTRKMAEAIGEGLRGEGVDFKVHHMAVSDRNDVITDVFGSGAVAVGSPTLNRGVLPTIAPILEDLKGLRFKNKIGAAFGTYGWSGEALKTIRDHLADCTFDVQGDGVQAKWQPRENDLASCREYGAAVGRALKERVG